MKYTSTFLKAALFATGLSGIVSEYTLSTLATYFLGDSVFQWTMIVSIMLFSMGLGSRLSKRFEDSLLEKFVLIEFALSIVATNVTVIVYTFFAFYGDTTFIIYALSILVGLLIGMEIPIVIRLNEQFQNLKVNISSALENDYYGSLAGGVFFAFIGLPHLGLTYTPPILGGINFLVALTLVGVVWSEIPQKRRKNFVSYAICVLVIILLNVTFSERVVDWGDKIRYKDRVVYSEQTPYQKIVLTYSKGDYWLFLNGNQQLSTLDEAMYHEPLVHPVVQLHGEARKVLVLGGGDGAAVRELLKYPNIEEITLVDLDPAITTLAQNHPVLLSINDNALNDPKVKVINKDGFTYLANTPVKYDVVIADFPDPRTVDLGRLYSLEFYQLCYGVLSEKGYVITQAGSPYYAEQAFECIEKTIEAAGFKTLPLHNQVLTLGEWGWVIGSKDESTNLKSKLRKANVGNLKTEWLTNESLTLISAFGGEVFDKTYTETEVNRLHNPVLYRYYLGGRWDVY
ncbi:MAG: polyamine aminopropyltransferase [Cyclobacteriaceae bacterium]